MSNHTSGCSNPDCMYSTCRAARARKLAAFDDMAEALRVLVDLETKTHRHEVSVKAFADARAALAKAGL